MTEGGGASECEVNVNIVERDRKMSDGARERGDPEGETDCDDDERGPEVECPTSA